MALADTLRTVWWQYIDSGKDAAIQAVIKRVIVPALHDRLSALNGHATSAYVSPLLNSLARQVDSWADSVDLQPGLLETVVQQRYPKTYALWERDTAYER